jgi:hypothetical protein
VATPPDGAPGAIPAPGDDRPSGCAICREWERAPDLEPEEIWIPQRTKFRPLLSTEAAEWDTEERGCAMPIALLLLAFLVVYICYAIAAYT